MWSIASIKKNKNKKIKINKNLSKREKFIIIISRSCGKFSLEDAGGPEIVNDLNSLLTYSWSKQKCKARRKVKRNGYRLEAGSEFIFSMIGRCLD